jgi:hypothetical protein
LRFASRKRVKKKHIRNLHRRAPLTLQEQTSGEILSMTESHSKRKGTQPVVVALAVAMFGVLAMLIVDHGPWSKPHVQTAEVVNHVTTGEAARAAGAAVAPTAPKPALEPEPPGPKPAQPASPDLQ